MKKNLTKTAIVACLLFACQLTMEAQNLAATDTNFSGTSNLVTFTFMQEAAVDSKEYSEDLDAQLDLTVDAEAYKSLINQGMFYDADDDHIYLNTKFDSKFSKVEVLDKFTSELLYSGDLAEVKFSKHMMNINPGTYLIILTNDAGNIEVDEVNIISLNNTQPMEVFAVENSDPQD